MRIKGYAFARNEAEEGSRRGEISKKYSHLRGKNHITQKFEARYGASHYSGKLISKEAQNLTEEELAFLVLGLCPFGGNMTIKDNTFSGHSYID